MGRGKGFLQEEGIGGFHLLQRFSSFLQVGMVLPRLLLAEFRLRSYSYLSIKLAIELGKKATLTTRAMEAWRLSFSSISKNAELKHGKVELGLEKLGESLNYVGQLKI